MRAPFVRLVAAAVAVATGASAARAQGTLSTQGFGYPLGGLSARAAATGGALGEFDHLSSRNPAALGGWGRSGLYFQYDPELRSLSAGANDERATIARFGTVAAGFTVGTRWAIGLSSHSFLDRTFATSVRSGQRLGDDSLSYTERFSSKGGIGDKRLAVAYQAHRMLSLGVGLHLYSGENRLNLVRRFDDSVRYGTLDRDITLSYTGSGASAGVVFTPVPRFALAASFRQGGTLKLRVVDTVRTEAKVPGRFGVAARVEPLTGLTLLVGADRDEWSRMNGLGTAAAAARDTWEYSGGAEFAGQRTRSAAWTYRLGYRTRDLPFAAAGSTVTEKIISGGAAIPVAGPRATMEVALQRAARDAAGTVRERAWLLSLGLSIRP